MDLVTILTHTEDLLVTISNGQDALITVGVSNGEIMALC